MAGSVGMAEMSSVESAWEQWRERLLSRFEVSREDEPQVGLYVLVDSRARPGLDKLLPEVPSLGWVSLWRESVLESYTDIAPYLIQIDRLAFNNSRDLQSRLVRRLWREGREQHMLTWLWSPLALEALSSHFGRYSRYATPDKRAFMLHFYDNRILERLRAVWTEEEAASFLSPCAEIWYRERDFEEAVWKNPGRPVACAIDNEQMLSDDQHKKLLWLGRADKLAMQLREMYGSVLDGESDVSLLRRISEQLERAARYRIKCDDDLLNYVSKGIVIATRFDEHPVIQERLRGAMRADTTYREALSEIDGEVLSQASQMNDVPDSKGGRHDVRG